MEKIAPKDNLYCIGHEKAEKMFLEAFNANTLHHAWIIGGLKGIGKATFAYKIARFLLKNQKNEKESFNLDVSSSDPVVAQISGGSNPNLRVVERDFIETDKKKVIKAIKDGEPLNGDELENLKKSSVIKVEDIRQINDFLSKTSFDGAWRVVLIDSIDDLNASSSNALLKILEEPPAKSILLLVSHHVEKLLPTIRSRCAKLILQPLSNENVASLLRRYDPELSEAEVQKLSKMSGGSIGKALKYAEYGGIEIDEALQSIFCAGLNFNLKTMINVAANASADENMWDLTMDLTLKFVFDMVKSFEKTQMWFDVYQEILKSKYEAEVLNMDKKQILINIFYKIAKVISDAC